MDSRTCFDPAVLTVGYHYTFESVALGGGTNKKIQRSLQRPVSLITSGTPLVGKAHFRPDSGFFGEMEVWGRSTPTGAAQSCRKLLTAKAPANDVLWPRAKKFYAAIRTRASPLH